IKAADCSWPTSSGRIPSLMQEDSASSIGPPMRKNRMSVPSFFNDLARISEPVSSAMSCFLPLDDVVFAKLLDLVRIKTKPFGQNFIGVLSEQRRGHDLRRAPTEAHRPAWPLERTGGRVLHRLQDFTPFEIRLAG